MVRHIILWKLKDMTAEEKETVLANIKTNLEGLMGQIDGLTEIKVHTKGLPTSNADLMLESAFTDAEALKVYATHEKHVYVADTFVRPYTAERTCLDFECE